jgi:predicted nucleic acid-binding OB-fold protein
MLTQDMFAKKFFDAWQSQIINPDYSINYKDTYTKDIIVQQLNKDNFPVYTVLFKNAYPVTVDAIELSADSSDTISTMSVSLAYDDWQSTDDLLDATLSSLNVALPGNVGDRIGSLVDDLTSKFNSI